MIKFFFDVSKTFLMSQFLHILTLEIILLSLSVTFFNNTQCFLKNIAYFFVYLQDISNGIFDVSFFVFPLTGASDNTKRHNIRPNFPFFTISQFLHPRAFNDIRQKQFPPIIKNHYSHPPALLRIIKNL